MDATVSRIEETPSEAGADRGAWYRSRSAAAPALLSVLAAGFYLAILLSRSTDGPLNRFTGGVDFLIDLSATCFAFATFIRFRHVAIAPLRHMTLFIGIASSLHVLGALVWLAYNVVGMAVPYPGLPDVFILGGDLVWIPAIGFLFWALDTNIRDELGPFVDILAVVWSLTIVVLTLLGVSLETAGGLLKLVLDIVYPFLTALACALLGALFLGPQFRRMAPPWRWFLALTYAAWLLAFLSNLGFSITTSLGHNGGTLEYFYFDGGPTDAIGAVAELLIVWAIAFLPLGVPLQPGEESPIPGDYIIGRTHEAKRS